MVNEARRAAVSPGAPPALHVVRRMPELSEISPQVIQECQQLERGLKGYERWAIGTTVVSAVAISASRLTYHHATGQWGEGGLHATLRVVKEKLHLIPTESAPAEQSSPDLGTVVLTGIGGFALGASFVMGAGQASLQSTYNQKCQDYYWAKVGAGQSVVSVELDKDEPVALPRAIVATDAEVVEYTRRPSSSSWSDSANRFARQNPNAAAGAMALAVIAAGAAIYLSGGTVLVFAL